MSKPVVAVFDDFFPDPDAIFKSVSGGLFESYKSIWDGVSYPGINQSINPEISCFVKTRIENIINADINVTALFARVMTDGMVAPHRIHSDKIMGESSMHIYLSKEWLNESGTAFWSHKTEGHRHTEKTDCALIDIEHDQLENWKRDFILLGKFNRAVIHDSCLFHSAEPGFGWGDSALNGRLVLTTFFSEAR